MQTDKKLSQAEIDELVRQMVGGARPSPSPGQTGADRYGGPAFDYGGRRVQPYDFRGAQRLSRDQLRGMAAINKTFTRSISTLLAHRLREGVSADTSLIQQMSYPEFTSLVPNPSFLAVYEVLPLETSVILQFDLKLMFFIYDRLCGGPGKGNIHLREPSELEMAVISQHVLEGIGEALSQAWDPELKFVLADVESNPFYLNLRLDYDQIVLITYEVRFGEIVDAFNLCVPYELVERVLPKSPHRTRLRLHRKPTELESERLRHRLERAPVQLEVILGKTTVKVSDLLELNPGDIITFDQSVKEPLVVTVNGLPKFTGMPGTANGRLAVRIQQVLQEEMEE